MIFEKYVINSKETAITISQTKIDSIRNRNIVESGLRVYHDNFIGVAGAVGNYNESDLEKKALESLNYKIKYHGKPSHDIKEKVDYSDICINEDEFKNEVEEMIQSLQKMQPNFIFSNKIDLIEKEIKLSNNRNLDLYYHDKYIFTDIAFKHKNSIDIMDGSISFEGRGFNSKEMLEYIDNICTAYNNKVDLPKAKKYPVIFSTLDHYALGVLTSKISQELHAQTFSMEGSLLSKKNGQKIFNDNFTLYKSSNKNDAIAPFFDAEGVINTGYQYNFIENGKIISPYTDKNTAHKFNLPLTGNAECEYDSIPSIKIPKYAQKTGLKIKKLEKKIKELLGGEKGIFVIFALGGGFAQDGNYATPVQLSLFFDGEKFIGRLPQIMVSSNLFEMFGDDFRGVSNDKFISSSIDGYVVMDLNVSKI